jgi:hypothetical protein
VCGGVQAKEIGQLKIAGERRFFSDESQIVIGKDCTIYVWRIKQRIPVIGLYFHWNWKEN